MADAAKTTSVLLARGYSYFILWLIKDYTAWQYRAMSQAAHPFPVSATTGAPELPPVGGPAFDIPLTPSLALSFARAKETSFDRNSPLELNLSFADLQPFLQDVPENPHPPPEAFVKVEKDIMHLMRARYTDSPRPELATLVLPELFAA